MARDDDFATVDEGQVREFLSVFERGRLGKPGAGVDVAGWNAKHPKNPKGADGKWAKSPGVAAAGAAADAVKAAAKAAGAKDIKDSKGGGKAPALPGSRSEMPKWFKEHRDPLGMHESTGVDGITGSAHIGGTKGAKGVNAYGLVHGGLRTVHIGTGAPGEVNTRELEPPFDPKGVAALREVLRDAEKAAKSGKPFEAVSESAAGGQFRVSLAPGGRGVVLSPEGFKPAELSWDQVRQLDAEIGRLASDKTFKQLHDSVPDKPKAPDKPKVPNKPEAPDKSESGGVKGPAKKADPGSGTGSGGASGSEAGSGMPKHRGELRKWFKETQDPLGSADFAFGSSTGSVRIGEDDSHGVNLYGEVYEGSRGYYLGTGRKSEVNSWPEEEFLTARDAAKLRRALTDAESAAKAGKPFTAAVEGSSGGEVHVSSSGGSVTLKPGDFEAVKLSGTDVAALLAGLEKLGKNKHYDQYWGKLPPAPKPPRKSLRERLGFGKPS